MFQLRELGTVMKCADATQFRCITNARENRETRPVDRQRENEFPLGRSTRRNTDETLESVMLRSPRDYSKKRT